MFMISTGVQELLLQALNTAFSGSMVMRIYSGTVPTNAHDSLGSAVLLREVSATGTGTAVNFEAATVNGMLVKETTETWSGTNEAFSGGPLTATFYRIVIEATDTGAASSTELRFQGSVGEADADLVLGSTSLTASADDPAIGIYRVGLPTDET